MTLSNHFARRFAAATLVFSGLLGTQAQAKDIRVDTTAIEAVSTMQFSFDAFGASTAAGITFGFAGTTTQAPGMTNEFGDFAAGFYLPITSIVLSPTLLNPTYVSSGDAIGAALTFNRRGAPGFTLANFTVDYTRSTVFGDFISGGQSSRLAIYSFEKIETLAPRFDATGGLLGLQLHEVLGNLRLSSEAVDSFGAALKLSAPLRASLAALDFGTLTQDINVNLRRPVNATPYTVAAVPEPGTIATLGLGLLGVAWVVGRRRRAA